jgi:hypothetical protein
MKKYVITHLDSSRVAPDEILFNVKKFENSGVGKFNRFFSESTAIYAIYKENICENTFISINHYRRKFDSSLFKTSIDSIFCSQEFVLKNNFRSKLSYLSKKYKNRNFMNYISIINYILKPINLYQHLLICHNNYDVKLLLKYFEPEFIDYLYKNKEFYPYNMVSGNIKNLNLLNDYCDKIDYLINIFPFHKLKEKRTPAFIMERYMSFLIKRYDGNLIKLEVLTYDI